MKSPGVSIIRYCCGWGSVLMLKFRMENTIIKT